MDLPPFAVTWDYRCPFARNAHEHLLAALSSGANWTVEFIPFSLSQVHVEDGQQDVWDDKDKTGELLSLQVGTAVRDEQPEHFAQAHFDLFAGRHDFGRDLNDPKVLAEILTAAGVSAADSIVDRTLQGQYKKEIREAYEGAVAEHDVFGVPTFIAGDQAAFARFMNRPKGDAALARATIERVVELLTNQTELNEFKRTKIAF